MVTQQNPTQAHVVGDIRTAARRFILEARDLGVLEEILTDDFVEHSLPPGFPENADGLRALFPQLSRSMPDARHTIDLELVDRDYVVVHCHGRGTNTGPRFRGEPATGRSAEWAEMHIFRMRDGRIAEHWACIKVDSILVQLGLIEVAGPVPPER